MKTRIKEKIKEVRIIPLGIKYRIEIIYEKEEHDLGLNNLITAVNNIGLVPIIIKGKVTAQ